jgi:uncharacterized protein (TIGR00255 family)
MISMTGFGHAERLDERFSAVVEIKSYNNRYLDINVTMPGILSSLEARIRDVVGGTARRGRVDVYIRIRELDEDLTVTVDRGALRGYLAALAELQSEAGIDDPVTLSHLLRFDNVLRTERDIDQDRYWNVLEPLLKAALDEWQSSRVGEGTRLRADILAQLDSIETCVRGFESHAAEIETHIKQGLRERFQEVLGNDVDESRVLNEVAVQLTRFSINEEIIRLRAHLESFREITDAGGAVGKKLDFLCQELNREINTTGSKSIIVDVNQLVVDAKDALENIREQLRNVE